MYIQDHYNRTFKALFKQVLVDLIFVYFFLYREIVISITNVEVFKSFFFHIHNFCPFLSWDSTLLR